MQFNIGYYYWSGILNLEIKIPALCAQKIVLRLQLHLYHKAMKNLCILCINLPFLCGGGGTSKQKHAEPLKFRSAYPTHHISFTCNVVIFNTVILQKFFL